MTIADLISYCQDNIIPLRPQQKIPTDKAWTVAESPIQSVQDAQVYRDLGYNLGFRIPDGILILDIDPKNGGMESFKKLPEEVQVLPRMTNTPSGGFHIYTQLPNDISSADLRTTVDEYPGIDFLKKGRQVVLPGSSLGDGLDYVLDDSARLPLALTPDSVQAALQRQTAAPTEVKVNDYLSNADLALALQELPVEHYGDNALWQPIVMACHHATAGEGLEAFLDWSLQDPSFSDHEQLIRTRWESMSHERNGQPTITMRTLCRELARHGTLPPWLKTRAGLVDNGELFKPVAENEIEQRFNDLRLQVENENSTTVLLTKLVFNIDGDPLLNAGLKENLLKIVAKRTSTSLPAIKRDIRDMQKNDRVAPTTTMIAPGNEEPIEIDGNQTNRRMALGLLSAVQSISHGVMPLFAAGQWWRWNGKHWDGAESAEDDIKRMAIQVIQNHGSVVTAALVNQIVDLARMEIAASASALQGDREAIRIYTAGCVIEFCKNTGVWTPKPHDPRYRNTSVVDTMYDPSAPKPVTWLKFLGQATTSEHARRTIACALIYSMCGVKPWLRKAFYFYGPPRSGKSTCLDLMEAMIGEHNRSALNVSQFGSKNGPEQLVGKLANISNETMSKKAINDEMFKALVSGESITVERKFCDPYTYRNTAKLLFAGNGFPRIEDESEAVWDRLVLLSFPRSWPEEKADHNLGRKLKEERSGILLWAMSIFAEEFLKDECRSAMRLDEAGQADMNRWRRVNNPALQWVRERLVTVDDLTKRLSVDQAYQDYVSWCARDGHHRSAKNHFSRIVCKVVPHSRDAHHKPTLTGVELLAVDIFSPEQEGGER